MCACADRDNWTACEKTCDGDLAAVTRQRTKTTDTCTAVLIEGELRDCGLKECGEPVTGKALSLIVLYLIENQELIVDSGNWCKKLSTSRSATMMLQASTEIVSYDFQLSSVLENVSWLYKTAPVST